MMYVVLINHKSRDAMSDVMAALFLQFPKEKFSIHGSEDKGYALHIEGVGDEKEPRKMAASFLKKWKPQSFDVEIILPK